MNGWRSRLVENLIVLGQVDVQVTEVAEFVKIDHTRGTHTDLPDCFILSIANKVLNDAVVVRGANAAEL